jgi:hypothetical protein
MIKQIIPVVFIMLMMTSSVLIAQDAQKETLSPAAKTCHMHDCFARMKQAPKKGFHFSIEWTGIYGGPDNYINDGRFRQKYNLNLREKNGVHINAGYQFNPFLYLGGGVGAEYQDKGYGLETWAQSPYLYTRSLWILPIYGEIKGYLLKKPISPFLQLRIGYAPALYNVRDGFSTVLENTSYNNISIGVRIYSHLNITAGYLFMYQPISVLGYTNENGPHNWLILDGSHPYQHMATVSIAIGM